MKKETAVEWLVEQLFIASGIEVTKENNPPLFELIEQAKAMEKEQIIQSYREGRTDQSTRVPKFYNRSSAFYYTSTYE